MEIIHLKKTSHQKAIAQAVRVLRRGGVVALPTETVYGLACDPKNAKAVQKIFRIKGRNNQKPVQLIAASGAQVRSLATINAPTKALISRHWPGPLTLLLPLKKGITFAPRVSPQRTIGIRVSSSAFIRSLARVFGYPLAATSANRSGNIPATSGVGVIRAFEAHPQKPDILFDAGRIPRNKPSTVAHIAEDGTIHILRQGGIRLTRT